MSLIRLGNAMVGTTRVFLMEQTLCRTFYKISDPSAILPNGRIPEIKCKIDPVQSELALLHGAFNVGILIAGFLATPIYTRLALITGKKIVLLISLCSFVIGSIYFSFVCYFYELFNVHTVLLTSLFEFVGGGVPVQNALLYSYIADSEDVDNLSNTLYHTSSILLGITSLGTFLGSVILKIDVWLLCLIGVGIYSLTLPTIILLPAAAEPHYVHIPSSEVETGRTPAHLSKPGLWKTILRAFSVDLPLSFMLIGDAIQNPLIRLIMLIFLGNGVAMSVHVNFQQWASSSFHWTLATVSKVLSLELVIAGLVLLSLPFISNNLMRLWIAGKRQVDLWVIWTSAIVNIMGIFAMGIERSGVLYIVGLSVYALGSGQADSLRSYATSALVDEESIKMLYMGISMMQTMAGLLPIDHENLSIGTYRNRFWVNDELYQPGGPVFIHDAGESNAERAAHTYLANGSSYLVDILKKFHGLGIVWEHRYFGDSLPFPVNLDTPYEHFKYLTYEQALADIPYFARTFRRQRFLNVDFSPQSTPWIMIGCSYPGARAALSRQVYPDTFYAAYASSAPVEARIDLSSFFDQIYRGMVAYGYGNCARDMHEIMIYVDGQLSKNDTASEIKQLFLGPSAEQMDNGDFALALANIYSSFQSHGMGGRGRSLGLFCSYLESDAPTGKAVAEGLVTAYGVKYMTERFAAWPLLTTMIKNLFQSTCRQLNTSHEALCDMSQLRESNPDSIAWTWLLCSQWGFFASYNSGLQSLVSRYFSLEYRQKQCYQQFPGAVESGALPAQPRTQAVNQATGGFRMRPSNVFWTVGDYDPWRGLTPFSKTSFAPGGVSWTTEIPQYNQPGNESTFFGYMIENAEHCVDFTLGHPGGAIALFYFSQALAEWL
ncbi:serine carboxypeptidase S28-domain-containing protein [Xylogone sp. PMI_703]|nr:serine carboxypeptidase S28-domain-containing protein [Xylogone sp. PMI_703]